MFRADPGDGAEGVVRCSRLEIKLWTKMYIGAGLSVATCVGLVYAITTSGDPSIEWMIWVFVGLTIALAAGGYFYETDYKKKHGDSWAEFDDILEDEG